MSPTVATRLRRNSGWLLLPILLFNWLYFDRLPAGYQAPAFDEGVPGWLNVAENISRLGVFLLPFLATVDRRTRRQRAGLALYVAGLAVYVGSWMAQIHAPTSAWSRSLIGFTAPAWSPALWLSGLTASLDEERWGRATASTVYGSFVLAFVVTHLAHAILVAP